MSRLSSSFGVSSFRRTPLPNKPNIPRNSNRLLSSSPRTWSENLQTRTVNQLRQNMIELNTKLRENPSLMNATEGILKTVLSEEDTQTLYEIMIKNNGLGYGRPEGNFDAIDRLAKFFQTLGLDIKPDELSLTCGTSDGVSRVVGALLSNVNSNSSMGAPHVILPGPYLFKPLLLMMQRQNKDLTFTVIDQRDNNFRLDTQRISASINEHTQLICLTMPDNPTGVVPNTKELIETAELCKAHQLFLVIDATYFDLSDVDCYRRIQHVLDETSFENFAIIGSFSKIFGPAYRAGWYFTKNLELKQQVSDGVTIDLASIPKIVDIITDFYINSYERLKDNYQLVQTNRESWQECLRGLGIPDLSDTIEGGLYMMLPTPNKMSGSKFVHILNDQYQVMVVPFSFFSVNNDDDPPFIRVTACLSPEENKQVIAAYREAYMAYEGSKDQCPFQP